jgi:hypothetical protein
MKPLVLVILTAVLALPASAQEAPSPAAEGFGSSAQTVSVAGGAVEVSVSASGAIDADRGGIDGASGELGVGANALGKEAGVRTGSGPKGSGPGNGAGSGGAPQGNATAALSGAEGDGDTCVARTPGVELAAAQIAGLAPSHVRLVRSCDVPRELEASRRMALDGNDALAALLMERGFASGDVVALEQRGALALVFIGPARTHRTP